MPKILKRLTIKCKQGLHARPAAIFVQIANGYKSEINVKKGRQTSDAKSIMGVLSLGASKGSRITLMANGPDAEEAVEKLSKAVSSESV